MSWKKIHHSLHTEHQLPVYSSNANVVYCKNLLIPNYPAIWYLIIAFNYHPNFGEPYSKPLVSICQLPTAGRYRGQIKTINQVLTRGVPLLFHLLLTH